MIRFSQQLDDADHRAIFRRNLRRRYPWLTHAMLTVAALAGAWAAASHYGANSPQTGLAVLTAAGYALFSMYLAPWLMETATLRRVRKSAQYGKRIDYAADEHGLSCDLNGRAYIYLWDKLTGAWTDDRMLFLEFHRTGVCVLRRSFDVRPDDFDRVIELAAARVPVRRGRR